LNTNIRSFINYRVSNTDISFAVTLLSRYIGEGLFGPIDFETKFTVKRALRELGEVTKTTMTVMGGVIDSSSSDNELETNASTSTPQTKKN
jgi:pseudouridine-5'-phosphate glycosidase